MEMEKKYQAGMFVVCLLLVQAIFGAAGPEWDEDAEYQRALLESIASFRQPQQRIQDIDEAAETQRLILEHFAEQRRQAEALRVEQERLNRERLDREAAERLSHELNAVPASELDEETERLVWSFYEQAEPVAAQPATSSGVVYHGYHHDRGSAGRTRYSADGIDIRARDTQGQTALHRACAQGTVADVQHLLSRGASVEARDTSGKTPLYIAWSYSNREVIEHLTGLRVVTNAYGNMVVDYRHLSTLPADCSRERMIYCKRMMCSQYIGELPEHIAAAAHAVAHELGMEEVCFFMTDFGSSFACDFAFPHIGISRQCMQNAIRAHFSPTYKALNQEALDFKRALYHELCHIRGRHTTLLSALHNMEADGIASLSHEMEAELGAMYYLFKIDGVAQFGIYAEDNHHPSRADHHRYIAQLYAALLENPEISFNAVIAPLVTQYFDEKTSGRIVVPDITARMRRELKARERVRSRYVDQWILA